MSLPWIALTGAAQAGKDTFAGFLSTYGYQRVAFADQLKKMALAIDPYVQIEARTSMDDMMPVWLRLTQVVGQAGWERAKEYPDVRRFLQKLGADGVRDHIDSDAWCRIGADRAWDFQGSGSPSVFTDCRFPNELKMVFEHGGIRVHMMRACVQLSFEEAGHVSETALPVPGPHDFIIPNDGTLEDLRQMADELVAALA